MNADDNAQFYPSNDGKQHDCDEGGRLVSETLGSDPIEEAPRGDEAVMGQSSGAPYTDAGL